MTEEELINEIVDLVRKDPEVAADGWEGVILNATLMADRLFKLANMDTLEASVFCHNLATALHQIKP